MTVRLPHFVALAAIAAGVAAPLSPMVALAGSQCGKASWYKLGGRTASGERNRSGGMTAAHRFLPFGSEVTVENLKNGKSVVVRINDRGPFGRGRVIDLSKAAAQQLGMISSGTALVRVDGPAVRGSCKA